VKEASAQVSSIPYIDVDSISGIQIRGVTMIRSEKAVSEVVGMVLILSIMVFVIGAIMIVGVPMIESGKERARMDVASNSFYPCRTISRKW